MAVAGAISLPQVLYRVIFAGSLQGMPGAFQPKLGPDPAQFPIIQQQSLPEVEGNGGYLAQARYLPGGRNVLADQTLPPASRLFQRGLGGPGGFIR